MTDHHPAHSRSRHSLGTLLILATAMLGACGGEDPLAFIPMPIPIGNDASEVYDVALVDPDHDGDLDLLVATADGLRYLRHDDGRWTDHTPGTALGRVEPADWLTADGMDMILTRDGVHSRLEYSGIGSWHEEDDALVSEAPPAASLAVDADFNGDGALDRAIIDGRTVRVGLRDLAGVLQEATTRLATDSLALRADGRRLLAGDLDGDGDMDLLAVGGRLLALLHNGGVDRASGNANAKTRTLPPAGKPGARAGGAGRRPWFTDATQAAGLSFAHVEGPLGPDGVEHWDIRPTMGPGAAWADVDGDGDPDLYVVGGAGQGGRLFLNDGQGAFTDVTGTWGLATSTDQQTYPGMGASFADWDEDGDPDLYLTNDGPNRMWRNDGTRFTDVSEASGTAHPGWSASAAWADIDRDGDLDLYITNYLTFDMSLLPPESDAPALRREDPLAMLPYVFPGQADVLYRNDGEGRFTDITQQAGLHAPDGKGLGAAFFDQDGDGWLDLYVVNDTTPNTLWRNRADGSFEEIALYVGLDDPRGGMGIALSDVDADGDEDLFVTNWQVEPNALYRNNAIHAPSKRRFVPRFEDVSVSAGLAQLSVGSVGWGCVLDDLDNDGDDDLYVANGYTSPDYETTMVCVGQRDHLYENVTPTGAATGARNLPRWELLDAVDAGPPLALALASRGAAAADYDGDGDLDLVVTNNNGPLVLLRNESGGRSLRVLAEGRGLGVTRDAVGARITLRLDDGSDRVRVVRSGSSYLSGHERGVRFGLGARRAVALRVLWPDGTSSSHAVGDGLVLRITQPAS
jgi:hypothetical protein